MLHDSKWIDNPPPRRYDVSIMHGEHGPSERDLLLPPEEATPEPTEGAVLETEKNETETLDPTAAEAIRAWGRQWLTELYNKKRVGKINHFIDEGGQIFFGDKPERSQEVDKAIAKLADVKENALPLSPKFRQAVYVFFETIIVFFQEKQDTPAERKKLDSLSRAMETRIWTTPPLTDFFTPEQLLILTTKMTRTPRDRRFASEMIYETKYQLAHASQHDIISIIQDISTLPPNQAIDIIHQLQTLALAAYDERFFDSAEDEDEVEISITAGKENNQTITMIETILSSIKQTAASPLVHYAAELADKSVDNHVNHGMGGILMDPYQGTSGRAWEILETTGMGGEKKDIETMQKEHNLKKIPLPYGRGSLYYIAADAIANYDGTGIPRYFASIQKSTSSPFHDYASISSDANLNPFAQSQDEDLALLLQHLHRPEMRAKIEEDLGLKLTELPLRSQIHLLRFLAGQDRAGFDRLRADLKKHPKQSDKIANAFLACAEDTGYADNILKLAETLDQKTLKAVLSKYLEITEATKHVREYLRTTFRGKDVSEQRINEVVRRLLHKANELLVAFSQKTDRDSEEILANLETIKTETLVFADTFKAVSSEHAISFQDIENTELTQKDSSTLTLAERQTMLDVFEKNRANYPAALLKETLADFEKALGSTGKEFFILRHGGEILAFIRFDELKNGNLYAGSLNVRPETKGSAIGSAMLRATLDEKARDRVIEAVAYTQIPMVAHYLGEFGFVAKGLDRNYDGTGQVFFKLERNDQQNAELDSHAWPDTKIVSPSKKSSRNIVIRTFARPDDPALFATCEKLLQDGSHILTRYIKNSPDKQIYLVFEKTPQELARAA